MYAQAECEANEWVAILRWKLVSDTHSNVNLYMYMFNRISVKSLISASPVKVATCKSKQPF